MRDGLRERLLETFRAEVEDRLAAMTRALELLAGGEASRADEALEVLLRSLHSLKGAARVVGIVPLESVCQRAESALFALRARGGVPSRHEVERLQVLVDALTDLPRSPGIEPPTALQARLDDVLAALDGGVLQAAPAPPAAPPPVPAPMPREAAAESVRISSARLSRLAGDCEELAAARLAAAARVRDARGVCERLARWRRDLHGAGRRRPGRRPRREEKHPGSRVATDRSAQWLADLGHELDRLRGDLAADQRLLEAAVQALQHDVAQLLMLPAGVLLEGLPTLARDLARDLGRELQVTVVGEDVQADRRVLDALRDPLVHIVRNAVDHGIEPPETRRASGKPAAGRLRLRVEREAGGGVLVAVEDDGRGVDREAVRAAARRRGMGTTAPETMDDAVLDTLLFRPGFSTRDVVTELSGRGLGLAIVADQMERLGGRVSLSSTPGRGTTVTLRVPVDLANVRGTVVRAAGRELVIPTSSVERVLRVAASDVHHTGGRASIEVDDGVVMLVDLAVLLDLDDTGVDDGGRRRPVLILAAVDGRLACRVDELGGEQEITVKGLGSQLDRVPGVGGLAVLGSGRHAPLLHVPDLFAAARSAAPRSPGADAAQAPRAPRTVLVAEDSITARTLLEAIFRAAGWRVRTAANGVDAWRVLHEEPVDLLVSDVEMPHMDGFELTARVRQDAALARLPVLLVTARASDEDRRRGVAAGASAYLAKQDFDQGDLLAAVERLV